MKITENLPLSALNKAKKLRKSGEGDEGLFGDFLSAAEEAESSARNEAPAPVVAPATAGSLLSLQEMPEEEIQRRRVLQQSQAALDALEQLRRDMLFGEVTQSRLRHMRQRLEQFDAASTADPHLNALREEVELRLAVEIAKLEA